MSNTFDISCHDFNICIYSDLNLFFTTIFLKILVIKKIKKM